jgi:hypothetical protein
MDRKWTLRKRSAEKPYRLGASISFLMAFAFFVLFSFQDAMADPYFNSSEPGCDGTNSSVLFCEDFETPGQSGGRWYAEDCDTARNNGGFATRTKGWCGTIFANPITPAGAELCGGVGVGSNCVGHHGVLNGSAGAGNMADHGFTSSANEIYVRYYQKWLSGYSFGAEKVLTFNETPGSGGIKWGNLHMNCGGGGGSTGNLQWQPRGGGFSGCITIMNPIQSGVWYYIEIHAKLSTTSSSNDGLLQVWVNNCGATGTSCTGNPTLRLNQQNMSWNRGSSSELLGSLWWENWANPGSVGISFIDQIKVAKGGPIGFMGATGGGGADITPPAAPINLQIQ